MDKRYAIVDDKGIISESSDREEMEDEFAASTNHVGDLLFVQILNRRR